MNKHQCNWVLMAPKEELLLLQRNDYFWLECKCGQIKAERKGWGVMPLGLPFVKRDLINNQ